MTLKSILAGGILAGALAFGMAAPSFADTAVVIGSGWQTDEVDSVGTPSVASAYTFTITSGTASLALTDAYLLGDTYTLVLNGVDTFTTTTGLTATPFDNTTGPYAATYGPAWDDADYSKILLTFGVGSYSFSVSGDCGGGCPAGFGYRVDPGVSGVPEPATWAMMLMGLGAVGAAVRMMRRKDVMAASVA